MSDDSPQVQNNDPLVDALGPETVEKVRQEIKAAHQEIAKGNDPAPVALEPVAQAQSDARSDSEANQTDKADQPEKTNNKDDDKSGKQSPESIVADKLQPVAQKLVGNKTSERKLKGYIILLPYFLVILILFILILVVLNHHS